MSEKNPYPTGYTDGELVRAVANLKVAWRDFSAEVKRTPLVKQMWQAAEWIARRLGLRA